MSGPLIVDRVKATSTTTGTGTLTVGAAATGYQGISAVGDGNSGIWCCAGGSEWEVFVGTVGGSGTTLTRDSVRASSNGGSAVHFSAGTKDVFLVCDDAAFKQVIASAAAIAAQSFMGAL